jgi:hypothetical protein
MTTANTAACAFFYLQNRKALELMQPHGAVPGVTGWKFQSFSEN